MFFRAALTAPPGVIMNGATVDYVLRATDRRGNTATTPVQQFQIAGIESYGVGLGGTNTTVLAGSGDNDLGGTLLLNWSNTGPFDSGALFVAVGRWQQTITEGELLINPNQFVLAGAITADAAGTGGAVVPIPDLSILIGLGFTFQTVFNNPLALSNGVEVWVYQ